MKLSEMRQLLDSEGIQLTKSLGQNFLHDSNQLRRIVDAAKLSTDDRILEIGPGLGPLTELLLRGTGEVFAIEKDRRLAEILRRRIGSRHAGFQLLCDDALDYLKREPRDWSRWKVVSNLPYSVASPVLVELACAERSPERVVVTLQHEVARRLLAGPGDADFGLLTLLVRIDFEPQSWFRVPPSCFFPEPDVDSACICLVRHDRQLIEPALRPTFTRIVKRAFSQRRKMMLKLLKQDWPADALDRACAQIGLSNQIRAEQVGLEEFVRLTTLLAKKS